MIAITQKFLPSMVLVCVTMGAVFDAEAAKLKVTSQGELGIEARQFIADQTEATDDGNLAGVGRLELKLRSKPWTLKARAFARVDAYDGERTAVYPEEFYLEFKKRFIKARVGYQLLNWTATEAFHPADVVNSRYLDSTLENADKLGEPMAMVQLKIPNGVVEGYYMSNFIRPIYPSSSSRLFLAPPDQRLGGMLPIRSSGAFAQDGWAPQWGARLAQTFGSADLAIHVIEHIDKEQPLIAVDPGSFSASLVFQPVRQYGLTYSHALGGVLVKAEAAYRDFLTPELSGLDGFIEVPASLILPPTPFTLPDRDQTHVAIGLEYAVSYPSGEESTWLVEGQKVFGLDDTGTDGNIANPLFQQDVLIGYRHAWNDIKSRTLLVTVIGDVETFDQWMANASYTQRISDTWGLTLGWRSIWIDVTDPDSPAGFEFWNDTHYGYTTLTRYF